MKKQLLIALNLISVSAFAQPVIPASHALENGTFTYSHADNQLLGSLDPGPAGANQTWDFSQYAGVATTSQTNTDCPGNPNCADFPAANKLGITGAGAGNNTTYNYSVFANNEYSTIGSKNVQANGTVEKYTYVDPSLIAIYPITYQQTFSDNWSVQSDPAGYNSSGSRTVTVDGYGTLITPLGTFSNTLRIKNVLTTVQNSPGNPALTTNSTIYEWVAPTIKGALLVMSFNDVMIPGSPIVHTRSFSFGNNGAVSIEDLDDTEKKFQFILTQAQILLQ